MHRHVDVLARLMLFVVTYRLYLAAVKQSLLKALSDTWCRSPRPRCPLSRPVYKAEPYMELLAPTGLRADVSIQSARNRILLSPAVQTEPLP